MANLTHEGYVGSIEVSIEDGCLHGRVLFINDLITYEGATIPQITAAFRNAVERYLAHCKKTKTQPDKPCSGTFQVRLGEALHRKAAIAASNANVSLNEFVVTAVEAAVNPADPAKVLHEHKFIVTSSQDDGVLASNVEWIGAASATATLQ